MQLETIESASIELKLPEDMSVEEWATLGRRLCRNDQVMRWWIGDWAAFGVRKYGKLKEFAELNGIDPQTLMNLAWVSKSVETSRRRENLSWSKHAEVAALEPEEQSKWLEKAEKESLPVAAIRKQIRQSQGKQNALESDGPSMRFGGKIVDELLQWLKSRPEGFWDEERKRVWKERLKPVVDLYNQL